MKYRAELLGVENLDRAVQTFGNDLAKVEAWGWKILAGYPDSGARIEIYENAPVPVMTLFPPTAQTSERGEATRATDKT